MYLSNHDDNTQWLQIVSAATMVLAIHSHFWSSWRKGYNINGDGEELWKPYKLCDDDWNMWTDPYNGDWRDSKCPNIKMEQYFVSISIICFIGSLISWISTALGKTQSSACFRWMDVIFHLLRAGLLFIGASMFAYSAEQINKMLGTDEENEERGLETHFRRGEKLAAAVSHF